MRYFIVMIISQFLLFIPINSEAQTNVRTLEDVITAGLKNNFQIQLATNNLKIAENNNSLGNAGMLPKLAASGGIRQSNSSTETQGTDNSITSNSGLRTTTVNGTLSFDWTLFDGLGMFIEKDRLSTIESLQNSNQRVTVENTLSEIITSYYSIVQLQKSLAVIQQVIDFSNRRYLLVKKKYEIGSASELSFMQAKTDLNADSASLMRQQVALKNAKVRLNLLLVNAPEDDFMAISTLSFDNPLNYSYLKEQILKNNNQLKGARLNEEIALMEIRLSNAPKYPQIDLFADYNLQSVRYNYGSSNYSNSNGPVAGVTLTMPIFDGFNKTRVTQNARIEHQSAVIYNNQITAQLLGNLYQRFNEYENNIKLIDFETRNLEVAKHNTTIAFEKYRVGELSDFELRQIQLAELQNENSLINAQFSAKTSEVELLRLSGELISKTEK